MIQYWVGTVSRYKLAAIVIAIVSIAGIERTRAAEDFDFAHQVAPILREHCGSCHTGSQKKGGFSLNTREEILEGGESGEIVQLGSSSQSELIARIVSSEEGYRMPPEGAALSADQVAVLKKWVDLKLPWEAGFQFGPRSYDPPLKPRTPSLPPAQLGRENPIDRIVDHNMTEKKIAFPAPVSDEVFLRRVYLDLVGLLPTPEEREAFLSDPSSNRRERLVESLLSRNRDYAEHWLSFWNDLLRNDYSGTGFITGGREQVTKWLYDALVNNMPYDQFARELIAPPTPASAGYGKGIKWRGDVSAGQTVEIQFAQSVGQTFLGINLKCASCHDSFIDRWTLEDAYGLAAIYSERPLEIHRCDKPIGKQAKAAWLFEELGQVDTAAAQPERLKQLAALMTHPENGRFSRTIVNRLWHRMMGHGIVHPVDAMQTEPWNEDLLDFLAVDLAEHKYDLKRTLSLIATSQAYQGRSQILDDAAKDAPFQYAGPRAKRMTAEQFVDTIWQFTSTAPSKIDAEVVRGRNANEMETKSEYPPELFKNLHGEWIWTSNFASKESPPAGYTATFRNVLFLSEPVVRGHAVITCDNEYRLLINGQLVAEDTNWETVESVDWTKYLRVGSNEILVVAKNAGSGPNPAALYFEGIVGFESNALLLATSPEWEWVAAIPGDDGKFAEPVKWQKSVAIKGPWANRVGSELLSALENPNTQNQAMVRASLVKADFLMRTLGRPNRDQIVSVRPEDLSTLEAMDLSNGPVLADILKRGAQQLKAKPWKDSAELAIWLTRHALSRDPTKEELAVLLDLLTPELTEQSIEDTLWSLVMLPEFQLVR